MAAGSVMPPTIVPLRTLAEMRSAPGKQYISTTTPVELRSVTPGAEIYFTVDGTRPEVNQRFGQKATYHYTKPISLLTGKQVIKAIARDRDGRDSAVVTKTFFVSYTKKEEEEKDEPDGVQKLRVGSYAASPSSTPDLQRRHEKVSAMTNNMLPSRPTSSGAHFLSSRLDRSSVDRSMNMSDLRENLEPVIRAKSPAQVYREGQETDFVVCVYCHGRRPNDPFCRFCPDCAAPIAHVPPKRATPPAAGEFGQCLYCQNSVPLKSSKCVVCDAPMAPQLQPQATKRLQRRIICSGCGMANPPEIDVCVACETKLTAPARDIAVDDVQGGTAATAGAAQLSPHCKPCNRSLSTDAKCCDMCGRKVVNPNEPIVCGKCKANNSGTNIYCTGCGISLEKYMSKTPGASSMSIDSVGVPSGKKNGDWLIVPPPKPAVPLKTQACQTDGLFYPSAKSLENLRGAELGKVAALVGSQDRATKDLTQTSPGNGYWRQQTDHICGHIKAYSQNSSDFQAAIGHQRMGRVMAAIVRQEDQEVTMSFTFELKGKRGVSQSNNKTSSFTTTSALPSRGTTPASATLSEVMPRPASAGASLSGLLLASSGYDRATGTVRPDVPRRPSTSSAVSSKTRKKVKKAPKLTQSTEDCLLLRELGPDGEGRKDHVLNLLSRGASSNCRDRQSLPALSVSAANGRVDSISILVDSGAKLNQQDVNGNTALHAAIVKGDDQVRCVEELLRCGINADAENKLGQTAYELAVARNIQPLVQCLASNIGTQLLAPLSRSRPRKL